MRISENMYYILNDIPALGCLSIGLIKNSPGQKKKGLIGIEQSWSFRLFFLSSSRYCCFESRIRAPFTMLKNFFGKKRRRLVSIGYPLH